MRQSFDNGDQSARKRVADAKKPGRKHQKRPGSRALERRKSAAKVEAKRQGGIEKARRAAVSAYWRGEAEEIPG